MKKNLNRWIKSSLHVKIFSLYKFSTNTEQVHCKFITVVSCKQSKHKIFLTYAIVLPFCGPNIPSACTLNPCDTATNFNTTPCIASISWLFAAAYRYTQLCHKMPMIAMQHITPPRQKFCRKADNKTLIYLIIIHIHSGFCFKITR